VSRRAGLALLSIALVACDPVASTEAYTVDAVVIATHYTPATTSTGVGFTTGGNMAITTSSASEVFAMTIELPDGSRDLVTLDRRNFLQFVVGDVYRIPCERRRRESGKESHRCRESRGTRP
jgi:hypothetical protein